MKRQDIPETSILIDWQTNKGRSRIQIALVLFRLAQRLAHRPKALTVPVRIAYKIAAELFVGFELPLSTIVGPRLTIHHGKALVVNGATIIGADVTLRHATTLGSRRSSNDCPIVEDHVNIGPSTCVLGAITIGQHSTIGAGSVVLHSVDNGCTVAGNPAVVITPTTRKVGK